MYSFDGINYQIRSLYFEDISRLFKTAPEEYDVFEGLVKWY